jgi:membrane-associated phospholipid phosphatase
MSTEWVRFMVCCGLLAVGEMAGVAGWAQNSASAPATAAAPADAGSAAADSAAPSSPVRPATARQERGDADFAPTELGASLFKNIALDQKAIWTSPFHLRPADVNWILPAAAVAAVSLASDTHISAALTKSPSRVSKSNTFSNYGVAAFGGVAGGAWVLGKITHDDHEQETGLLAGEAAVDAVGVTSVLQFGFGRQRPTDGTGQGLFWKGGSSFPSDHSTAAWAVASVVAHEYPSTWTKLLAYGLASAVSASRVTGKDHFPTDVIAGAAIGWLVGQHVYRAHHDPELGGGSWETFSESRDEHGGRNIRNAGSPYVPLDSWIYPALDRLISMGYVHSAFGDVRPLTRSECASLVEEAGENLADGDASQQEGRQIYLALQQEFRPEMPILDGDGAERSLQLESMYTSVTQISGRPLNDSDHFGQTIIDNFGRPYEQGFNTYDGFSGYATTGPYAIYVRGEFQHAPAGPALPLDAREVIANVDLNPLQPATAISAANQFRLLDTYISANVNGWDLSFGKQSLWWGRGVGGALLYSDNAEPIYMFRARPTEAFVLPWIFSWLGPMKTDFFFGKLSGNEFPARPLIHGVKVTVKRTQNLEISFIATSELGGVGRPLTPMAIFNSFFSVHSSDTYPAGRNPGKRTLGGDVSYTFPHLRNWLSFYVNGLLPEANNTPYDVSPSPIYTPQRLAIRTGIYMPRLPRLPKLDFRVEAAYTDPPTPRSLLGDYVYWNDFYHDLYVNKNNLIGDWVGREGMGFQGWTTYWISPKNSIQFGYRHAKVDPDFIPSGETINDGSVKVTWQVRPDWNVSTSLQYEKWFAPILASTPQTSVTSAVQIEFTPRWGARQ